MSFILYADKTRLTVREREPITSGSIGVYPVRFGFSEDWDGMDKTASFRFHSQVVSVPLDENGECVIPWEVIDHFEPKQNIYAGVCGTKEGTVVLPTIWASLGELLEGVAFGQNARPPTPNLWEQKLEMKQDKLTGEPGQIVGFDEDGNPQAQEAPAGGTALRPLTEEELDAILQFEFSGGEESGGGTSDHRLLLNRDADGQHPVSAIEGLQDTLDTIPRPMTSTELRQILLN